MTPLPSTRLAWLLLALAPLATARGPGAGTAPPRPNILLLIADDLGVDKVAAYGEHPDPPNTPRLDALAADGILFRNAWSDPSCSPTRANMLTGRYGFRTGIGSTVKVADAAGDTWALPAGTPTLPRALAAAGYRTAVIGKWHLGHATNGGYQNPVLAGFGRHLGSIQNLPIVSTAQEAWFDWEKNVADRTGNVQVQAMTYATTEAVDDALATIQQFGARPWFVWLAFNAPHVPFHEPPADLHTVALPPLPSFGPMHDAMVEAMDTEIGRLLDSLDPETRARTLVVFVGDNGTDSSVTTAPFDSGHAKGKVFEGGVNVPLVAAGAGVAATGRECVALVNTTDLFATFVELAGASAATALDSVSLVPYLSDPGRPSRRDWAYATKFKPNGFGPYEQFREAVREARYKLIRRRNVSAPDEQLFDLVADPFEQDDLLPDLTPEQELAYDRLAARLDGFHRRQDLGEP